MGSFNIFPTNILRDIYAHTHRVSYGGIKKQQLRVPSHPQKGVNSCLGIVPIHERWGDYKRKVRKMYRKIYTERMEAGK